MSDLKNKTVSGIKWSAFSQLGRQGTQLLTTVLLARLLTPSDFGLVSMAMAVIGFVTIFKDLGTSAAIIQQKELSEPLLSSVFWANVGFGAIAMLALFFFAPLGGLFYQEPRVVAVLQVLSTTFLLSSFGTLHQALLERSLSFDSLAKVEIVSVVVGGVVGVVLALANVGVWSLVVQSLTSVVLVTVLLWLSSPWKPRWLFQWREIKAVGRFSLNLTGFNVFNYFARNADYLFIGRYLGAQDLGYYTLAYRILLFPLQNISAVIGRVMYPVLSATKDNKDRFAAIYLKITGSIALISFPLMMGMIALARPFVLTFFGEKWQPAILLIVIFAPVGLIQSIGTTVGSIYQAMGKTDWMFRWGVGAGSLAIIAFAIGLHWGIIGVALAYTIATLLLLYPSFAIPFQLIELRISRMLRVLMPSLFASGLMFLILWIFRIVLPDSLPYAVVLILSVTVGVIFYGLASWFTNQEQLIELWSLAGFSRSRFREAG